MLMSSVPTYCIEGKVTNSFAVPLQELVEIATKLAQLDEALRRAQAFEPHVKSDQAQLWHDISIKSLMWTRSLFTEQQNAALGQMQLAVSTSASHLLTLSGSCDSSPSSEMPLEESPSVGGPATPTIAGPKSFELVGSLRNDLEKMKEYAPERCLIVKRIKRLGLDSPQLLRDCFGKFGQVTEVFAAHSQEKRKTENPRVRAAAIGFIVMQSENEAALALAAGPTIMIGEVSISVQPFSEFSEKSNDGNSPEAVWP